MDRFFKLFDVGDLRNHKNIIHVIILKSLSKGYLRISIFILYIHLYLFCEAREEVSNIAPHLLVELVIHGI